MNCDNLMASLSNIDVSSLLSSLSPKDLNRRKRRRGEVANPSNTLDALVARKADEQPFEKRYLSEQEAIEGPDDEVELKRMETDPDVSTRTCSTCGYQGKWVSEMIRHKRVHTSERPFKCRYCSRTSKWKADLIRHVAKTHGIRVVSKYSRSKVFDSSNSSIDASSQEIERTKRATVSYRCSLCSFEDERVSVITHHVNSIHQTSACVCRCGARFDDVQSAVIHSNQGCGYASSDMIFNIIPTYDKPSPLSPCRSETSTDSGIHTDPEEDLSIPSLNIQAPVASQINPVLLSPATPNILPPSIVTPDISAIQTILALQSSTPLISLYLSTLLQNSLLSMSQISPSIIPSQQTVSEDLIDVEM